MIDEFCTKNYKLRAKQAISKSHLVEHKKYLQTLCPRHDALLQTIMPNCVRTLYNLCITNNLSDLRKVTTSQLTRKKGLSFNWSTLTSEIFS